MFGQISVFSVFGEIQDLYGDGEIDVQFGLKDSNGEAIMVKDKAAILHVKFEILREKSMSR